MIGSIRGKVIRRTTAGELHIEVGGVGYRVTVAQGNASAAHPGEKEVQVWTHQHRRDDGDTLYGFWDPDERDTFEQLLRARGVGPALALAMLGVHSPAALARAVATRDVDALCMVAGIGPKTAARLLVDLQGALDVAASEEPERLVGNGEADALSDVRAALAGLGYSTDEVSMALRGIDLDANPAEMLRLALRRLAVGSTGGLDA